MNNQLQELLGDNEHFNYDDESKTWCLSGIENGLGWETDDFEAATLEEAEIDAIDFIEAINEGREHDALMAAAYEG